MIWRRGLETEFRVTTQDEQQTRETEGKLLTLAEKLLGRYWPLRESGIDVNEFD